MMALAKSGLLPWLWVHLMGSEPVPLQWKQVAGVMLPLCMAMRPTTVLKVEPGG